MVGRFDSVLYQYRDTFWTTKPIKQSHDNSLSTIRRCAKAWDLFQVNPVAEKVDAKGKRTRENSESSISEIY